MPVSWKLNTFGGIIPKVAPRLLPDNAAQVAENVWLNSGDLRPINAPSFEAALADTLQKTIYKWRRNNSFEWLSWPVDTDVAISSIADDQWNLIYTANGSTLGMILWDGAKTVISDISKNQPGVIVATPTNYQYPTITAHVGSSDIAPASQAWINDNTQLKLTFTTVVPSGLSSLGNYNASDAFGTTANITSTNNASMPLYDSDADKSLNKIYGTLKFVSFQLKNEVVSGSSLTVTWTATFDFGFTRTSTAYWSYVQSSVDKYGQETPCSNPCDQVTVAPNQKVILTNVTTQGSYTYIYRSAMGNDVANFFFLGLVSRVGNTGPLGDISDEVLPSDSGGYADKLPDGSLQDVMQYIENPPANISGIVRMPGGWLAGFYGKEIYFSEPFKPYSWPTKYRQTMFEDVIGLGVSGNDLVVLTKGDATYITGTHPSNLSATGIQIKTPIFDPSCVSKRSIATLGAMIIYACPDGLAGIQNGVANLLTCNHYNPSDWQLLGPSTMISTTYEDRYFGFCAGTTLIFQLGSDGIQITTTTQLASGVYQDLEDDGLYMIQGANINLWDGGDTPMVMRWRSKELELPTPFDWACGRVLANGYTATSIHFFDQAAAEIVAKAVNVQDYHAFRLIKSVPHRIWSFEIHCVNEIKEIIIAQSMEAFRK